ncbi:MAG: Wzt carbohydrate-binding domain-containing protein, partial [Candidatus Acidiferrum sp.]
AAVENLCTRGIWIDGGCVRQDGPTREVIQSYMSTFAENQDTASDLSKIESRRGTGEIRYTGLSFLSLEGQPQPITRSGDSIRLRFFYHAEKAFSYASFGFRLSTELGTLITETSTYHHGLAISVEPGDGYLDLEIDLLNLLPARYYFSLWITGSGGAIYDGIEHCARIEIELANIYRSGRNFDGRNGLVYFPQRWNLAGFHGQDGGGGETLTDAPEQKQVTDATRV